MSLVKSNSIICEAREQVANYEARTEAAKEGLSSFQAEHLGELIAIEDEFKDYKDHPLWQEYTNKQKVQDGINQEYKEWGRYNIATAGWEGEILFPLESTKHFHNLLSGKEKGVSKLPPSKEEFDRRLVIAMNVGSVARILSKHNGEPIVRISNNLGALLMKKSEKSKSVGKYTKGEIFNVDKTQAVVGQINQPDDEPQLYYTRRGGKTDRMPHLGMAEGVSGSVADYSLPEKKRDLKNRIIEPRYNKYTFSGFIKEKSLPLGRSILGDFSLSELKGRELMVIDAPHATASDRKFPNQVLVHRPKQRLQSDPASADQAITIFSGENYSAVCIGEGSEISLPAPQHNTFWLIGNRAIEANLEDAIHESTTSEQRSRGVHSIIQRVTEELVELAQAKTS